MIPVSATSCVHHETETVYSTKLTKICHKLVLIQIFRYSTDEYLAESTLFSTF